MVNADDDMYTPRDTSPHHRAPTSLSLSPLSRFLPARRVVPCVLALAAGAGTGAAFCSGGRRVYLCLYVFRVRSLWSARVVSTTRPPPGALHKVCVVFLLRIHPSRGALTLLGACLPLEPLLAASCCAITCASPRRTGRRRRYVCTYAKLYNILHLFMYY